MLRGFRSASVILIVTALVACGGGNSNDGPPALPPPPPPPPLPAEPQVTLLLGSVGGPGAADGPSHEARFFRPTAVVADKKGNRYVIDSLNRTIRRIAPDGTVSTLAGKAGRPAASVDGVGMAARFMRPIAMALDEEGGALYVSDRDAATVRKIDLASAVVSTVAGVAGAPGYHLGVEGTPARLLRPMGLAWMGGQLYIADAGNAVILRLLQPQRLELYAGQPQQPGFNAGDTVAREAAQFDWPSGIAAYLPSGELLVVDTRNCIVRAISDKAVRIVVGRTNDCRSADGARDAAALNTMSGTRDYFPIGVGPEDRIYFSDVSKPLRELAQANGAVRTVQWLDNTPKEVAGISADPATGMLLLAEPAVHAIRKAQVATSGAASLSTLAGQSEGSGVPLVPSFQANTLTAIGTTRFGALLTGHVGTPSDATGARHITATGAVESLVTLADDNTDVYLLAQAADGTLYTSSHVSFGQNTPMSRVKGWRDGQLLFSTDSATVQDSFDAKPLYFPNSIDTDSQGRAVVADSAGVIQRIDASGQTTRLAGATTRSGGNAVGDALDQASFKFPFTAAVSKADDIFVLDLLEGAEGYRITKISPIDGRNVVTLITDQLLASNEQDADNPLTRTVDYALAADDAGNVYVADGFQCVIRRMRPNGQSDIVAGQPGRCTFSPGDRTIASLARPKSMRVSQGKLYVFMDKGVVKIALPQ